VVLDRIPPMFDANAIVGPLLRRPPGAPEDGPSLLTTLDYYGIQRALVTHGLAKWHDPTEGNARLLEEIAGQERLIPCWVVLPSSCREVPEEPALIEQLLAAGVRAARLCPVTHRLSLAPWAIDRLLGVLAERRVPLFLDFDNVHWSEERPWDTLERVCRTYPQLPVVLLREGQANFRILFALLDRCPNLIIETSYLQGHDVIRLMVERWGTGRLVFGTGLPIFDPGLPVTGLTYAGLEPAALAAVGGGTLDKLLEGCVV
jgi:hypothetical protein